MAAKAKSKIEKVMGEFKRGELKSGRSEKPVTSRKQAVAIALSEARRAGAKIPEPPTKGKERHSPLSEAERQGISAAIGTISLEDIGKESKGAETAEGGGEKFYESIELPADVVEGLDSLDVGDRVFLLVSGEVAGKRQDRYGLPEDQGKLRISVELKEAALVSSPEAKEAKPEEASEEEEGEEFAPEPEYRYRQPSELPEEERE